MAWNGSLGGPTNGGVPVGVPTAFLVSYREIHPLPSVSGVLQDAETKTNAELAAKAKPNANAPPASAIAPDTYIAADGSRQIYRPDSLRQFADFYSQQVFERLAVRLAASQVQQLDEAGLLLRLYSAEQASKAKLKNPKPLCRERLEEHFPKGHFKVWRREDPNEEDDNHPQPGHHPPAEPLMPEDDSLHADAEARGP
jgi:hypothetical protein